MATETALGVGIRRNFVTLGDRNFEDSGTVQYKCNYQGLNFLGTAYNVGDLLPFDVGGVAYSLIAIGLLQLWWNAGWIAATV